MASKTLLEKLHQFTPLGGCIKCYKLRSQCWIGEVCNGK